MNNDLKEEIIELQNNKKVFYEYIKAFYNIEKVKETLNNTEEFKKIEEFMKKEDNN